MAEYKVITNPVVNVTITNSASSLETFRRFQKDLTVAQIKGKLELITGSNPSSMSLEVYDKVNKLVCKLDNDDALLGSYPIDEGFRLHVIDRSGNAGQFEDLSKVEKYEMGDDDYSKRTDSVREFKRKMKLGEFQDKDPEEEKRKEEEKKQKEQAEKEKAKSMVLDSRCEVSVAGQPKKRGTVKYAGLTDFKPGYWVGVQYDEPMGKNDGSVQGKRYFECPPKYGAFVRPSQVTVGDFPELGLEDEDMEM